jgi:methyl-accepting chemotaxis protein
LKSCLEFSEKSAKSRFSRAVFRTHGVLRAAYTYLLKEGIEMTIKQRLTLLISLLVILASVIIGAISVFTSMNIIEDNTENWMLNEASIGALLVNSAVSNSFDILKELTNIDAVLSMDWERQRPFLRPYVADLEFEDIAVISPDGTARHVISGIVSDFSKREYVQRALRGEQALSEVISPQASAVPVTYPVLNYVVPVRVDGRVIGALLARTNALKLTTIITNIKARGHSYAFMINSKGEIIAHTVAPETVMTNIIEAAKSDSMFVSLAGAFQYMIDHKQGGNVRYNIQGANMLCAFMPVGSYDMIIGLTSEKGSLMVEVMRLRNLIIIVVAALMAVGLGAALQIAGFIAKRLKNVRNTVARLGSGDFSQHHKVLAVDEIGAIAEALNQCMDNIKHLVKTIKERTSALSATGHDLAENMVKTTESMGRIEESMDNVEKRMENQSASVIETSSTMRQIINTINKLSDNVNSQSESVAQSSSAIEEMLANIESVTQTLVKNSESVRTLSKASDTGRTGLQEVAADIQEIARESEGLLEINSVMENIAGQTNLLSMNAAIEAAHAGDAGKGFAVVAAEIRKLAESSSEQSKTISGVLKKIKSSIDKITQSTNTVLNKFEDIEKGVKVVSQQEDHIRISMEEQSTGSKQILEAIGKLNDLTRQVKSGSSEMREGSKQVITESENLEQVTAEITTAMKDMGKGTHQIAIAVKRVNDSTTDNKENIAVLEKEVQKFKV